MQDPSNNADVTVDATPATTELAPVSAGERLSSVDVLRGFSLLGILLMNIASFGLPAQAYENPSIAGGDTGLNLAVWFVNFVLFEGKMRAIFSMLFGAGVILFTTRAEETGGKAEVADVYYRRMLWLLFFGVLHGFFVWYGDILYLYALCGLFLFPLRKLHPAILIIAGMAAQAVPAPGVILKSLEIQRLGREAQTAREAAAGREPTEDEQKAKTAWEERLQELRPDAQTLQEEIDAHQGGYWGLFLHRAGYTISMQSSGAYRYGFWDAIGMMLIGMALMKMGVLSGRRSPRFYTIMMTAGYVIGLPVKFYMGWTFWRSGFDPALMLFNYGYYSIERLATALGHVAAVMLVFKAGALIWFTSRLAAVGRMAFTNYLSHSIICTTLFEGYGFGLFGKLQRYQLYVVVVAIWIAQLLISPLWLRWFRFGPLEWLWRSLTYWKVQPMLVRAASKEEALQPEPVPPHEQAR